jgi:hypothetical protein
MASKLSAHAAALVFAVLAAPSQAAENAPSYGQELAQVYGTYQSILANKEACTEAAPNTRGAIEKSYKTWQARNGKTLAELDDRLTRMIRGASKDDKEYARNIGKYEGAMLQQRNDARKAMLAQPRDNLDALCKSLPDLLSSKESDLETVYADELKSIRSRH